MIRRLYIHNFRCLENFELRLDKMSSVLLIGNNGSGKTSVGMALEILQSIARGTNRASGLVRPKDLTRGRDSVPMRFEIEIELNSKIYTYALAFEFPDGFKEPRVVKERLAVDGNPIFNRELAQVRLRRPGKDVEPSFAIDWHLVALPIVQQTSKNDPLFIFRQWLANTLILRPIPSMARGDSESSGTLQPNPQMTNFGEWFTGLLVSAPSAYEKISDYLKGVMPDFQALKNTATGRDSRSLSIQFSNRQGTVEIPFEDLSDGEKCFLICALVMAANDACGPLLCFWDEPDNYLAPGEVGATVIALRKAFRDKGQLIVTSHNPEAIRHFVDTNTLILFRHSHLEPTMSRSIEDLRIKGDLKGNFIDALVRGDIAP
ncbi:MAG: AAA family ATPase [Rhodomicrobium sp.]